jgi:uncharacterized membrane protein (DUF2068 family)
MTAPPAKFISKPEGSNRWLILIAAFKLAQALLFVAIGVGALKMVHKDVGDELARLAHHLRFNPESRFVDFIVEKASILDDRLLKRIGTLVFIYAGLDMIEGIGLYLEKAWAEYFTLILTASFLPWEVFEIFRRLTVPRVALFTVNAMVLVYLLKLVIERGRLRVGQAGDPGV